MGSCCTTETKKVKIERKHDYNNYQMQPSQPAKSENKPMTADEVNLS
jgi:hypothetical protein